MAPEMKSCTCAVTSNTHAVPSAGEVLVSDTTAPVVAGRRFHVVVESNFAAFGCNDTVIEPEIAPTCRKVRVAVVTVAAVGISGENAARDRMFAAFASTGAFAC